MRQAITASRATPTLCVFVIMIGPSRNPLSSTHGCASHFAVSIQAEEARVNRIIERSLSARQDCGYTCAHRAFANLEFAFATDQCRIADFDTSDIGDRVKFPRRAFKRNRRDRAREPSCLRLLSSSLRAEISEARAPKHRARLRARPRAGGEQTASMSLVIHQLSAINHQLRRLSRVNFFVRLSA